MSVCVKGDPMAKPNRPKSATLTIAVTPAVRSLMNKVAAAERRSVTNLIEVLIERRAAELGIKE
jgi:predicted HicB family RNase H-like nuclease